MRLIVIVAAVVLAIVAWTGFWFYAADRVERTLQTWTTDAGAGGAVLSYDGLKIDGYPFRLQVRLTAPRVTWPVRPGRPEWQAEQLAAIVHPWNYRHIIFDLAGGHRLAVDLQGRRRQLTLEIGEGLASFLGDPGRPERLSIDLREAALSLDDAPVVEAARVQLHLRPGREDGQIDLAASFSNAMLQPPPTPALGTAPAGAEVQGTFSGPLSDAALPEALAQWRDAGGSLELQRLQLEWGELNASLKGALALDPALRPAGTLTARIRGHEELLDAAVASGQLPADMAPAARTALGLLAVAGGGVLAVPLTLQDGRVYLGPVQIGRLRPLL